MGRVCTICEHPDREAMEDALVAGTSYRAVAAEWHVGRESVRRHAQRHLSAALAALDVPSGGHRAPLSDRVETLIARCEVMFTAATSEGRTAQALAVVKELRACLELAGRASGELREQPAVVVNLMASPEWLAVRATVLSALLAYPDARAAVAGRLLELEAGE